jgi:hypothetical protein
MRKRRCDRFCYSPLFIANSLYLSATLLLSYQSSQTLLICGVLVRLWIITFWYVIQVTWYCYDTEIREIKVTAFLSLAGKAKYLQKFSREVLYERMSCNLLKHPFNAKMEVGKRDNMACFMWLQLYLDGSNSSRWKSFTLQKKIVRIMAGAQPRTSCTNLFKQLEILPVFFPLWLDSP